MHAFLDQTSEIQTLFSALVQNQSAVQDVKQCKTPDSWHQHVTLHCSQTLHGNWVMCTPINI